jgi:Lrp/AsnC family transcriptional regulator
MQLDDTDRRILRHWLVEPGQERAQLAARAGVTPATLWRRLDRLRESGVIKAEGALIDWRALGYEVPEVIGIETFLGRVDVRLNVIARDMGHWTGIYRDRILTLPHIAEVEALMLVSTIKQTGGLPL